MQVSNWGASIAQLSESEGVFTTAQAERTGIPRDALHDAVKAGRLERIMRGAYRMVGAGVTYVDELIAVWKLTNPAKFTYERMKTSTWDGVVVGGSTAASLLEVGDFHLSTYRLYSPKRFNTRNRAANFGRRNVSRSQVAFVKDIPVTRPERTIFDLMLDNEDFSLIGNALHDAWYANRNFNFAMLEHLLKGQYKEEKASRIYKDLLSEAGLSERTKDG